MADDKDNPSGSDSPPRNSEPPPPPNSDAPPRRSRLESILPELIKRGIEKSVEAGMGTLNRTDEAIRGVVGDVKLPREIVSQLLSAMDDTKNGVLRVVGREVREFLEATDLATELQKVLTSLSFEIKTEIRFIPNKAGTGVKADVKMDSATVMRKDRDENAETPDDAQQGRRSRPPPKG
ncbi:MAG: hypothetical protein IPK60_01340 [Sandaracinaceae bacterium]|jgi:hypothetical protein|nr:hypothetical protein [Sandaracinaceae bacterium]